MPRWFVYTDEHYYPSAAWIEAETAEEAAVKSGAWTGAAIVVVPAGACVMLGTGEVTGGYGDLAARAAAASIDPPA